MGVVMAGLSPHPPLIVPEIGGDRRHEVQATIDSLKELAKEIKDKEPELIITISPHGPVFKDVITTFGKQCLEGDFRDFGHPEVSFEVRSNTDFTMKLQENSKKENIELLNLASEHVNGYNSLTQKPHLDHGVLVPLYFLRQAGIETPLVALTMGLLEYRKLYDFGQIIQDTLVEMGINAVVIASGDLSHRLTPGAPAGFNPHGKEFDQKFVDLISQNRFEELLEIDDGLIKKAGECGLRPTIIMLGSLRNLDFITEIKSYEGPFGVGYAVAGFYREEEADNDRQT